MSSRGKRIKRAVLVSLMNHLFCGTHFFTIKRILLNYSGIHVGKGSKVVGPIIVGNNSQIDIGENCWIGQGLRVYGDGSVHIGNNCDFAPEVGFLTGSHKIGSHERRAGEGESFSIIIGDGCWIGTRSSIMGNVSVGDGTIIGACAFVIHSVDADVLVGGVPARIIKQLK